MPKLVSDSQMESLRSVAQLGMVTEIVVLRWLRADNVYGDEQAQAWTPVATVMGWVRGAVAGDIRRAGGLTGVAQGYRLFVPVETDIRNGDRVHIVAADSDFTVQDTNIESTWRVVMRVEIERVE